MSILARVLSSITLIVSLIVCRSEYNLIDPHPSCISKGICPYATPIGPYASYFRRAQVIHPNPGERTLYLFRNIPRLFPCDFIESKYGKYINARGGVFARQKKKTYYACAPQGETCPIAAEHPMYWLSCANQAARFNAWQNLHCDNGTWSDHDTCKYWANILFNGHDEYNYRTDVFCDGEGNTESEAIWTKNIGFINDDTCAFIFSDYHHLGIGKYPESIIYTHTTMKDTPYTDYPIPHCSHFDETQYINDKDYNTDGKHLVFMLQWHGIKRIPNIEAKQVYLLYQGDAHLMNKVFGDETSNWTGFWEIHFNIPSPYQCRPYIFVVIDTDNQLWRMPESDRYYFGISKAVSWSQDAQSDCEENHYYKDGNIWKPNGVDTLGIWSDFVCIGCDYINELETVYNGFLNGGAVKPDLNDCSAPQCIQISELSADGDSNDFNVEWYHDGCYNNKSYYKGFVNTELQTANCNDYKCITFEGFPTINGIDYNGNWRATGDECVNSRSTYSLDGADAYLCLSNTSDGVTRWGFTDTLCDIDTVDNGGSYSVPIYCQREVQGTSTVNSIRRCHSGYWKSFNGNEYQELNNIIVKASSPSDELCPPSKDTDPWFICYESSQSKWIITPQLCNWDKRSVVVECNADRITDCQYPKISVNTSDGWSISDSLKQHITDRCGKNKAAFTLNEDCETDGVYGDTLCFNGNNTHIFGYVEFDRLQDYVCIGGYNVYIHVTDDDDVLYLFFNDIDVEWVMTWDIIDVEYVFARCFQEDLMECVEGAWTMTVIFDEHKETVYGNYSISVMESHVVEAVDGLMSVRQCAFNDENKKSKKKSALFVVLMVIVVIIVLSVAAFLWFTIHRRKLKGEAVKIDEYLEEEQNCGAIETVTQL